MFKTILKHLIYETCIDMLFENIEKNFNIFTKRSLPIYDIESVYELIDEGEPLQDIVESYCTFRNIWDKPTYGMMKREITELYNGIKALDKLTADGPYID